MAATLSSKTLRVSARPATFLPRRAAAVRVARLAPVASSARDESGYDSNSEGLLSGEWPPAWSLSLPTRPQQNNSPGQTTMGWAPAAEQEAVDPENIISGEWEASWSQACYNDVLGYFKNHKSGNSRFAH